MAREAKLGLVVIGILLVVFSGLLLKRLSRPTKVPMASAPVNKANESSPRQSAKPSPPTMVTPKPEMGKPPELMAGEHQRGAASSSEWNARSRRESPSALRLEDPVTSRSSANTSLMAAGDRYSSATEVAPSPRSTAQPYRSGYAGAGDETSAYPTPSRGGYAPSATTAIPNTQPSPHHAGSNSTTPTPNLLRGEPQPASPVGSRYPMPDSKAVDISRPMPPATQPDPFNSRSTPSYTPTAGYAPPRGPSPATTPPPADRRFPSPSPSPGYDRGHAPSTAATPISNPYETNPFSRGFPMASPVAMPSSPAVSGAPVSRDGEQYTVQPNDSFWIICEKVYGNGAYFKALYEHNRKRHKQADELTVGQTLSAPDEAVLRRMYPDLCPKPRAAVASTQQRLASVSGRLNGNGRIYTVVEGDTLFEIARYELGKPARWGEIYDLNRDILGSDFDYLRPGTELILPDDSNNSRNNITRQPTEHIPLRY